MKIKKSSIILILFAFLNLFQFLWYLNPLSFFGEPRIIDEETAIARARAFDERLGGSPDDGMVFSGEYIEGRGRWLVRKSPPRGYFGWGFSYVIRARDGRVIDTRRH